MWHIYDYLYVIYIYIYIYKTEPKPCNNIIIDRKLILLHTRIYIVGNHLRLIV